MGLRDKKMKTKDAITKLWKDGYFSEYRVPKEVHGEIFRKYGVTSSNIVMSLKGCTKFIRKTERGWIQKRHYTEEEDTKRKTIDYFKFLNIHPEIEEVSKALFEDGHYAQAIFEAFKRVNNMVKEKADRQEDGRTLMLKVFSPNAPILKFNELLNQSERDEQEGFMYLFAGAITGIRNPKAHENIKQKDKQRAIEYLVFASFLCKRLAETRKDRATSGQTTT